MVKLKKIIITSIMAIVWLVMLAMVIPMKSGKGQVVTVIICLAINSLLGIWHGYADNRVASFREWLKN